MILINGTLNFFLGEDYKEYMITENACEMQNAAEYHNLDCNEESPNLENEDSNSRTSNTEEVNPTSCSDHDYSEPQADNNVRQIVTHQVAGGYAPAPQIIQQILPDQRLVFSTQPNVVFQQSRLHLPQRVLIAPTNVVLSQISHAGQNVIFPQVISPGGLILSEPMLRQPETLIENPNNGIVYTNPETEDQTVNYQSSERLTTEPEMGNQTEETENIMQIDRDEESERMAGEEEETQASMQASETTEQERREEEQVDENEGEGEGEPEVEAEAEADGEGEGDGEEETEREENAEQVLSNKEEDSKPVNRQETSKIADDWDEANESSGNLETRSDGPTRPDFF